MFIFLDHRHLFTFILCIMYRLWIFCHTWPKHYYTYIYILYNIIKAMCTWHITYRWKNDDDQKSWKSCPICPRNRERCGKIVFFWLGPPYVIHKFCGHYASWSTFFNELHFKFYQDCWTIRAYSHKYWNLSWSAAMLTFLVFFFKRM